MKHIIMRWAKPILLLIGIALLAFSLRVFNLTILPIFADEAIYIRWSQVMVNEPTLRFLPLSDGKQPLYMWVLMFLVRRFSDPLFIGRLVSVFTGVGTTITLFCLTYYLFRSHKAALVASLLWALSPFAVFFDRMALVDSMLAFFATLTLLFAVITAKTKRLDMALFMGFSLGAAALTKSPALFIALLIPSTWILSNWNGSLTKKAITLGSLGALTGVSYVLALGLYNIQRLGPNFQLLTSRTKDYVFPISHLWQNPRDPFIFHFDRSFEWIGMMGPWVILILAFLAVIFHYKKRYKEQLLLVGWFLIPILIQSEFAKVFTARYILFTLPPLCVLAASLFIAKEDFQKRVGFIVLLLFVIFSFPFNKKLLINPEQANLPRSERSGYLEEWTAGTGIAEVANFVKEEHVKDPGRQIVVGTEGYFGTLPDGLQIYLDGTPNVVVYGVGLHIGEVPSSLLDSVKAGNKTYLAINSSRLNMEKSFEDRGLIVVKEFKKATRPEGIREYAQFGPNDFFYLLEVRPSALKES